MVLDYKGRGSEGCLGIRRGGSGAWRWWRLIKQSCCVDEGRTKGGGRENRGRKERRKGEGREEGKERDKARTVKKEMRRRKQKRP